MIQEVMLGLLTTDKAIIGAMFLLVCLAERVEGRATMMEGAFGSRWGVAELLQELMILVGH